jgi:hypothetical protein
LLVFVEDARMRALPLALAFGLALAHATACGSSASDTPLEPATPAPWEGTYSLKRVNGAVLPVVWSASAGSTLSITGRTIYVYTDHSWSALTSYTERSGIEAVRRRVTETGTWTRSDPEGFVTLTATDRSTQFAGTALGATMMLSDGNNNTFDYAR